MSDLLSTTFAAARPAFVAFVTAGYPTIDATVPIMKALQEGGADVIELGVPFSDPLADGAVIQKASNIAIKNGMSVTKVLDTVTAARAAGVTAPVVLMGYLNPLLAYGIDRLAKDAKTAGVNGFIIVDLPPEEAELVVVPAITRAGLSFIPLLTPTTAPERVASIAKVASSFIYCVSVTGVTGARGSISASIPDLIKMARTSTRLPLAVGFGISTPEQVRGIAAMGVDGVVVGSKIISELESLGPQPTPEACAEKVRALVEKLTSFRKDELPTVSSDAGYEEGDAKGTKCENEEEPGSRSKSKDEGIISLGGKFGDFGGCYIPETLVFAHQQLWLEFQKAIADPSFIAELDALRKNYVGGPTPVYFCERLTAKMGGAKIYLKREDLAHTGAHKINNSLGQALLVKRMGKQRVIAETGAGQHGVATATACALMGLDCVVYMGAEDVKRQSLNVFRMKMLGAEVRPVTSGSQTLKDAINEAMRDWVTNVTTTHYIVGSAIGPHPFPTIVKHFQSVVGNEARAQMLEQTKALPNAVVACVGGGSNAIGIFSAFLNDKKVKLIGVEAGGVSGPSGPHSATLSAGVPGVLHGTLTYLQQTVDGQIDETHSISAGLDYPGVGPEHAFLKDSGRVEYMWATDSQALEALQTLSQTEGIIPALEPSHAIYKAMEVAAKMPSRETVLIMLSGRGDKDMITVARALGHSLGVDVAGM